MTHAAQSRTMPNPAAIGALMLGAALALFPVGLRAQSTPAQTATAQAALKTGDGQDAGSVTLADTPSGALHVVMKLSGLPAGEHAVHIHETGKCEGPTFETAGGHLSGGKQHGAMAQGGMHSGDMPNVVIPADGAITAEVFLPGVSLAEVLDADGGAFVVHAKADDYVSQPSGKAGDRLACGVFEAAPTAK